MALGTAQNCKNLPNSLFTRFYLILLISYFCDAILIWNIVTGVSSDPLLSGINAPSAYPILVLA